MILFLFTFPILWAVITRLVFKRNVTNEEFLAQLGVCLAIVTVGWFLGKATMVADVEYINSEIVAKNRDHGTYLESYSCHCRTVSSGSGNHRTSHRVCQTCYRRHYTVTWSADTRYSTIQLDHEDRTSSSVYNLPDPPQYKNCYIGEPATESRISRNFVKGVPNSILHLADIANHKNYPAHPEVLGYYHYNRVLNYGSSLPQSTAIKLNAKLNEGLKALHRKEVNPVLVFSKKPISQIKPEFDSVWKAGKRNDVIVYINLEPTPWEGVQVVGQVGVTLWVDNIGNEKLGVILRQELLGVSVDDLPTKLLTLIANHYRLPASDAFDYLEDEVEPSKTTVWVLLFLSIALSIGLSIFFIKNEVDNYDV